MIDPPESAGYKVGQDHVNAVVTSGQHEATDTGEADDGAGPVEEDELSRRICDE